MKRRSSARRIKDAAGKALQRVTNPKHPWRPRSPTFGTTTPTRTELLQALARISPEHREILIFKDVQGLSYAAIARRLGVPEDSVANRLLQARRVFLGPWTALRPTAPFLDDAPSSVPAHSEGATFPRRRNFEEPEGGEKDLVLQVSQGISGHSRPTDGGKASL